MTSINDRIQAIEARIRAAEQQSNRKPGSVKLLAVSKKHPTSAIIQAYDAGLRAFGENYVQEALAKIESLAHLGLQWHLIGPLQSNKTQEVAAHFDWFHGLERFKIAQRLSQQRPSHLPPLQVLIQVNVSQDAAKAGVAAEQVLDLARQVLPLPGLKLRGLMCILAAEQSPEQQQSDYQQMQQLLTQLQAIEADCDTLSMGMSDDLEAAIAQGSTLVRIGTAIFGQRGAQ